MDSSFGRYIASATALSALQMVGEDRQRGVVLMKSLRRCYAATLEESSSQTPTPMDYRNRFDDP